MIYELSRKFFIIILKENQKSLINHHFSGSTILNCQSMGTWRDGWYRRSIRHLKLTSGSCVDSFPVGSRARCSVRCAVETPWLSLISAESWLSVVGRILVVESWLSNLGCRLIRRICTGRRNHRRMVNWFFYGIAYGVYPLVALTSA